MKKLVEQAMREGAVGLSSAFNGGGYDNPEEMFEMAGVAAQYGGYYATHVGSEGYQLTQEIKKAIQVAEVTHIPIHIFHLLREGYWADIVVFDPKTVRDVATFEKPKQYPAGIEHVLVNGIAVVENGNHTSAKPGKAILGPGFRQ